MLIETGSESPAVMVNGSEGGLRFEPSRTVVRAARRVRVCFPFSDGLVGGSHISALTLIKALDRTRFDPTIVLLGHAGKLGDHVRAEGFRCERLALDRRGGLLGAAAELRQITAYLSRQSFDLVHTNEGRQHVLWGIAARLAGIPQIWHHRGSPQARGLRYLAPLTAARVISVSRFAAPERGLVSAAGRGTVIHSPFDRAMGEIDRAASRAAALAETGLDPDSALIGYFAQFGDRKRPLKFVEAIAAAKAQSPGRKVFGLLFGEEFEPGFMEKIRAEIVRLGVEGSILMMGFRKPAAPWMAACDVLLVPAVQEPFGRTLIEAMMVGTPVVAAASGGNTEAITDRETGLLVQADDAEAMARGILLLVEDSDFSSRMAGAARSQALTRFGINLHARAVEKVYGEIATGFAAP